MSESDKIVGRVGSGCQRTLKSAINCTGIGLHGGLKVNMTLRPAAIDSGIRFHRVDVRDRDNVIPALHDRVTDSILCTTVGNDADLKVATIEHLMAALAGLGVDNVDIELDGPEVPIMDGSSEPFVFLLECAGIVEQAAPRRRIRILKPVEVRQGEAACSLTPSNGFSVGFEIEFDSSAIGRKDGFFDLHNGAFKREISRARTFGFERDIHKLWELGLARGGSLENAVVIGTDDVVLNDGGLRYEDEFVRHKILDSVGDLYLAGAPLLAHFQGSRSGHALNHALLRELFADASAWSWSTQEPVAVLAPPGVAQAKLLASGAAKISAIA